MRPYFCGVPAMLSLVILLASLIPQEGHPVRWSFQARGGSPTEMVVQLEAHIEHGWYMYDLVLPSDEGPLPTEIRFSPSEAFSLRGGVAGPAPKEQYDPNFAVQVRYHSGSPIFQQRIQRHTTEAFQIMGEVEFMCCNDVSCLPPKVVPFEIAEPAQSQ